MIQSDKLKKIIAEVKEESSPVITLSNELIADFSKDLDSAISELDMIMESIQALLMPVVVMEQEGDIVEELKKLDMRRNVMVGC